MWTALAFLAGMMVGASLGFLFAAMLHAGADADDMMEHRNGR